MFKNSGCSLNYFVVIIAAAAVSAVVAVVVIRASQCLSQHFVGAVLFLPFLEPFLTSGKHVRKMYTPLNPTFDRKTGVCKGILFFYFCFKT